MLPGLASPRVSYQCLIPKGVPRVRARRVKKITSIFTVVRLRTILFPPFATVYTAQGVTGSSYVMAAIRPAMQ